MKKMFQAISTGVIIVLLAAGSMVATSAQESIDSPTVNPRQSTDSATPSATPAPTPAPPAVQPVNLTVSPISVNLVTDPGTTTSSSIRIRNNSDKPEFLRLRLNTFSANQTGDAPVIREFDPTDESARWITFSETEFRISPGEWKTLQLTFSPPATAALGYYYAILVERQSEALTEEGASLISGVPAILVLSEVRSPLAKRQLELVSFKASKNLYEYLPAEFEVVIRNAGNIQTLPLGDIFIDGQSTNDIGIMQLNPAKGMILPGTERTFKVYWDDGFPRYIIEEDEFGNETRKLAWDFSNADRFRFGKYSATTLFVYDDGERDVPTEATLSFWVVPWKLLLIMLFVSALILVGIILPIVIVMKRLKKNRQAKL